ncbi:S41 family peptidase [Zavarzinella formosa]|uniref:S41 family peptidase n=1 Tax=Zavarzinella formosa TaxID=360055 RepID=UPI000311BCEB|nr:S41 family peptidase [Zavarzinella formosa]
MIHRSTFRLTGLALAAMLTGPSLLSAQFGAVPAVAPTSDELIEIARSHQKNQRWEEAIQSWLRILSADKSNEEARLSLAKCVRHALQANRHRDPNFQAKILAMPQADVLALYDEVIRKIQAHYVDPGKVTVSKLFRQGMDEYLAALSDPTFVRDHLRGTDEAAVTKFRASVQKAWGGREVSNVRQAVEVVAEVASASKRVLGLRSVNAVVLEFICGACNSLDEYSAYLPANQLTGEDTEFSRSTIEVTIQEGNVGYLRILRFEVSTPAEVDAALKNLVAMAKVKALVIDLRGNSGGSFPAAVKTAEKFLPAGIIVTAQGPQPDATKVYTSTSGNTATDLPAVLLINGDTASSAEVFAVALRENQRAKLVGTATFGKGSLQNIIRFTTADEVDETTGKTKSKAGVRLTIARLLSPSGNPITGAGIVPDVTERDPERQTDIALEQARELARRYMSGPR